MNGYGLDIGVSSGPFIRMLGCSDGSGVFYPLSDDTTYHIVAVYDGVSTGSVYVNGVPAGEIQPYSSCAGYSGPAHLAVDNTGGSQFTGVMDEVAVYNYALSADRILTHYQIGAGVHPKQ